MTPEALTWSMLGILFAGFAGMLCLFVWWLLNAKNDIEGPKNTMVTHEGGPEDTDSEVYL